MPTDAATHHAGSLKWCPEWLQCKPSTYSGTTFRRREILGGKRAHVKELMKTHIFIRVNLSWVIKPKHLIHNSKISEIMLLGGLCIGKFKTIACGSYVDSVSLPRKQQRCQMLYPCHRKFSTSVSMKHQTATLLLCLFIPLLAWSTAPFHIAVFFKFDPTA